MGFTVNRQSGRLDTDFQDYARLLRQQGADLGKLPRVRDPITKKRWLYVWKTRPEAQAFADELNEQMEVPNWEVLEVNGPLSEGPLGPLVIQLVRQADGLTFTLHPLSRATIRSAFPQAVSTTTFATTDPESWHAFRTTKGGLPELVRHIAPGLTGLDVANLETLGYAVVDADSNEMLLNIPPALTE